MAEIDLSELERYLRIYQENPDSRVFAPLADMYRRLGRLKEAEEIVREGMERHPYYAGGRVAFANILLDAGEFEKALSEASQVVTYYPDNLLARKILIRVLGATSQLDRARREFEALKALAPQIAADPELEQALHGPKQMSEFPVSPKSATRPPPPLSAAAAGARFSSERTDQNATSPHSPEARDLKYTFKPMELQEKTDWHPIDAESPDAAPHRSFRLKKLFKKKVILETWLRRLSESSMPR